MFFESESAFFGSECYRQQRSVRVKLNAGLYAELLLPPAITKLVIHLIVNPTAFFQRIQSLCEVFFSKLKYQTSQLDLQFTNLGCLTNVKATLINISILTMDQMAVYHAKGVNYSVKPTETQHKTVPAPCFLPSNRQQTDKVSS